jgi:hypothetical protein
MKNPEQWAQESLQNNCGTELNYELIVALVESVRTEFQEALTEAISQEILEDDSKSQTWQVGVRWALDFVSNFNKDPK